MEQALDGLERVCAARSTLVGDPFSLYPTPHLPRGLWQVEVLHAEILVRREPLVRRVKKNRISLQQLETWMERNSLSDLATSVEDTGAPASPNSVEEPTDGHQAHSLASEFSLRVFDQKQNVQQHLGLGSERPCE